jgi:hypothetical protein
MPEFETNRAKYIVKDGIFFLDYISDTYYDADEATESIKIVNAFLDHNGIETLPIIVSADTCNPKFTFSARSILASKEAIARYSCIALVTNNPLQKILGTLYVAMSSSKAPIKIFDTKEEAIAWVEEIFVKELKS